MGLWGCEDAPTADLGARPLPRAERALGDGFGLGNGQDGALVVNAAGTVVNTVASAVTAAVSVGDTQVTLASNTGFTTGRLVLLWQSTGLSPEPVSGAQADVDLVTAGVGQFELVRVTGTTGGTIIQVSPAVQQAYLATGAQAVLVREYTSVTVGAAGTLVGNTWDGAAGGVVAFLSQGALNNDGAVSANGLGFRGGPADSDPSNNGCTGLDETDDNGARRGEGISPAGFGATQIGQGNKANGGGGGICHNSGGGGGGNGGRGGKGGLTWTGDTGGARDVGGLGGVVVTFPLGERLSLGGGGGAGHGNNNLATDGARGGGVVFARATTLTGTGVISANGASAAVAGNDGAGGGGAGGSVVVRVTGALNCTPPVQARGGNGGIVNTGTQQHGAGGGGGGGHVVLQGGSAACTTDVSGGVNGYWTDGSAIQSDSQAQPGTGFSQVIEILALDTSIVSGPATPTSATSAVFDFSSTQSGVTYECSLDGGAFVACSDPATFTGLSNGPHTLDVRARNSVGDVDATPASFTWTVDPMAPSLPNAPGIPDLTSGTDSGRSSSDNLTNDTTPDFTLTCLAGATVDLRDGGTTVASGTCSAGGTITFTAVNLPAGTHTMTARQTTMAGTSGSSGTLTVVVDTTVAPPGPPDLVAASDSGTSSTDNITNDNTPSFTVTCESGADVVLQTSGGPKLGTSVCVGGTATITTATLPDGTYALQATQTDGAGNISTPSTNLSVTVDTAPPAAPGTPNMTAATDTGTSNTDEFTGDTTPDFTITCTSGLTVELLSGTTVLASGACPGGGTITLTSSALAPGNYTATARQRDTAGNTSTSGGLPIIINTPPTITSDGGGATASLNAAENQTAVTDVNATDPNAGPALVFSISGGADAALFSIVGTSGVLTFVAAPNREVPTDANTDGVYEVTVQVSDGMDTDTQALSVTVTNVNEAPTITSNGGGANAAISVAENLTAVTTVMATDPDASTTLTFSISGGADQAFFAIDGNSGVLTFASPRNFEAPADAGTNNTYVVQVRVSDGTANDTQTITVTITNVNEAPTISNVADQSTPEDTATAAIPFTVGDPESAAGTLTVSAASSDTTLVPVANIVFGGSGANRTVTLTPAANQTGTSTITLTVSDGTLTATDTFVLTVTAVNDAPTISNVVDQSTPEDTATAAIAFTVGDAETAPGTLTVTAASSNTGLVPVANIVFGGSGANRTVTLTPAANQTGTSTITLTVSDGTLTATDTLVLTVTAVNDAPTISNVVDQTTPEDTATAALAFTVGDVETAPGTLTVSAASSNTGLVPVANIVFGGSGANRTVTLTPAANQTGTSTITLTVTDAGGLTATDTFVLTVTAVNDAPTISNVVDQSTPEDTATAAIAFTVGDAETAPGTLTVSAASSNTGLIPVANIVFGGSGANRTVTLTPAANQTGTSTITLTVSDGTLTATDTFVLTVTAVNDAPTISNVADQTTPEDTATAAIPFTVGDVETAPGTLTVSAASSNTALIPVANIVFGGSGANRTVTLTPAANQTGTSTITLTVSDGTLTATDTFVLTVTAVNDAPTISNVVDQTTPEDTATAALAFTVGDTETAPGTLTVSAASTNTALIPVANIVFGGSGANRTVTLTPAANQTGTSTITLTVTDAGGLTATDTFVLTVTAVNDAPTISNVADQSTPEDTATGALAFTVGDAETAPGTLTVSAASSNTGLIPVANIVFGGSGANRTVTLTPAANQTGTSTITLTVSDGTLTATDTFVLTVTAVNDAPTISNVVDQTTPEDTATAALAFTVGDPDDAAGALTVSAASSNTGLIPVANIVFGGSGANRTVTLTPAANQTGTSTITLTVTDAGGLTATDTFVLTVTAVNDAPVITSDGGGATAAINVVENQTAVTTVAATDPDTGAVITYSIAGGADAARFSIDPMSGALVFAPAPDFETPTDADGNNTYLVTVRASDGTAVDTQDITVTVTNAGCSAATCNGATPICDAASEACVRCIVTADCGGAPASCEPTRQCTLPAPVVTAPADASTVNVGTPTYTGTATANTTVNVVVDGTQVGTVTSDGLGNWTFPQPAGNPLSVGSHTVRANTQQGSGVLTVTSPNSNTNTFNVVTGCLSNADCSGATPFCDTSTAMRTCVRCLVTADCPSPATCDTGTRACQLPAPVVATPADSATVNTARPAITGTGPANATLSVSLDGTPAGTTTSDAAGNWTFTPSMDLALGAHNVNATATVGSGVLAVTSSVSNTNAFTVVSGCLGNGDCTGATPVCLINATTFANTCVRCESNADCPAPATCTTANQCALAAPVVVAPANGSTSNNPAPTYSGTGPANATITVTVDSLTAGTVTSDGTGAWSLASAVSLGAGGHTVSATARVGTGLLAVVSPVSNTNTFTVVSGCLTNADCSGATPACNTATNTCVRCVANADCPTGAACTAGLVCQLAPPVITSPADQLVTSNVREPIVGTSVAGTTVTVFLDGVLAGTALTDGTGAWTYTPTTDLAQGPHTVSATASLGTAPLGVTSPSSPIVDFEVGCVTNADCSAPNPVCEPTTHQCVECLLDAQCPTTAPVCSTSTRTCTQRCDDDTDCTAPTPVCAPAGNPRAGQCVECVSDARCASPEPRCDLVTDTCVACLADADCSNGDRCDTGVNRCVDCLTSADCGGSTPICQQTTNLCRPCTQDAECGGSTPLCATSGASAGQCVACRSNNDCSGGTPICDGTSFTCRACSVGGTDCSGDTPACEAAGPNSGRCVECTAANGAECTGTTPVCDTAATSASVNTCVSCLVDADCPGSLRCNVAARTCTPACTMDSDCPVQVPVCAPAGNVLAGLCVQCVQDTQCGQDQRCANTTTDTCVGCLMDADCSGGRRCLLPQRTCEQCLTDADCPVGAPVCDPANRTCRACTRNAECGGTTPVCATTGSSAGRCVACNTNAECPQDAPVCDGTTRTCRACTSNLDCFGDLLVCETTGALAGRCVECSAQDDSACQTPRAICNTAAGPAQDTCVGCLQNADCPMQAPFCNQGTRTCTTGCNSNADCSGLTPICATSGANSGSCVGCQGDSDCAATQRCEPGTSLCTVRPPVVLTPADGATVGTPTPTYTGTAPANATVRVTVDGVQVGTVTADGSGQWSLVSPSNLGLGNHTVRATASLGTGGSEMTSSPSNTNTFRVVDGCQVSTECGGATPVCNTATNVCVRCVADADCPAGGQCTVGLVCTLGPPVITSPTDQMVTANVREPVVGTSVSNATITVFIDGLLAGTVTADATGNWTLVPSTDLELGPHTVFAVATLGAAPLTVVSPPSAVVDFEVGCVTSADCSAPNPVCEPTSRQCVQCLQDSECPMTAPVCSAVTRTCAQRCDDDTDCTAPTPVCAPVGNARAGQCVECVSDARCAAPEPRCDLVTDTCVACLADADCTNGDRCDTGARRCVDCLTNVDCGGTTPICQQTNNTCRPCSQDAECGGTTPLCSTSGSSAGQCVACRSNADCGGASPICDGTAFTCRPCSSTGSDCSGDTPACADSGPRAGRCVECTAGNATECSGATPLCDTEPSSVFVNTCISCVSNTDCPMDQRCNPGTRTCSPACTRNEECPTDLPVCAPMGNVLAGQCVQCVQDSQCGADLKCANTTSDTCVSCQVDMDCSGGRRCLLPQRTCEQCLTGADCPAGAPVCDPDNNTCRACTSNSECGGTTPVCASMGTQAGRCVQCNTTAECPADTPVCDVGTRTCRACSGNLDCSGDLQVCETQGSLAGRCVECTATDDTACETPRGVCNTASGAGQDTCVGCLSNTDCPMQAPFCDGNTRTCTSGCSSNAQCSGNTPVCATSGTSSGRCVACLNDGDCGADGRCDITTNQCVGCLNDSQCSGATPRCDTVSRTCVACTVNSDCPASEPVCDPAARTCRDCASSSECAAPTPECALSGTNAGRCVACTADAQCSGNTPRCDTASNLCVGCFVDSDCGDPAASRCEPSTGLCVSCSGDAQCGHLSGTPACGPEGRCVQCTSTNAGLCGGGSICDVSASVCAPPPCGQNGCDEDGDGFPDDSTSTGGCAGCSTAQPDFTWLGVLGVAAWRLRRRRWVSGSR